ncbi:MAG TPA: sulfate ABC transporter permease subunit CysT [Polyangiaceae bacterium]|nr:sulfate ABC transporter permease subunit CysT [Polyangiaceae bacterium]
MLRRQRGVLPGFRLSLSYTLLCLGLLVLLPLSALLYRSTSLGVSAIVDTVTTNRALLAFQLSFGAALVAACINAVFGVLVAWVLVRYDFPARSWVDALIDLPFALPTAVAGIALTSLYSTRGAIGALLAQTGLQVAFTRVGVVLALVFVGLPFIVRSVQPVLEELDPEVEEAAEVLGASRFETFRKVIFPALLPALLTGFALAFARGLGEYGSVVFISGNMPNKTEIVPLLIVTKLEQYDYVGATALASVMLLISFALLFIVNLLQKWARKAEA